jgi:hypothetical protein
LLATQDREPKGGRGLPEEPTGERPAVTDLTRGFEVSSWERIVGRVREHTLIELNAANCQNGKSEQRITVA